MKQQQIYFHTEKNLKQAEKILKKQDMQIIFKSTSARININDLNAEERFAWLQYVAATLKTHLKRVNEGSIIIEEVKKNFVEFNNEFSKYISKHQINPNSYQASREYEKLARKWCSMQRTGESIRYYNLISPREALLESFMIPCGILIAKHGTETVRFLEFRANDDPIVTLTGPQASALKISLSKKF